MPKFRAPLSAALALIVAIVITYAIARNVGFPNIETTAIRTVTLVKRSCSNVKYIQEQVRKKIESSKSCTNDSDCAPIFLGCPFGCRPSVNRTTISSIKELAAYIPNTCSTCEYRCFGGHFIDTCEAGECTSVRSTESSFPPGYDV